MTLQALLAFFTANPTVLQAVWDILTRAVAKDPAMLPDAVSVASKQTSPAVFFQKHPVMMAEGLGLVAQHPELAQLLVQAITPKP